MWHVNPDPYIEQIEKSKKLILKYGMIDGAHHKQWVLDQVLHTLMQEFYDEEIKAYNSDPDYKEWDIGIAP